MKKFALIIAGCGIYDGAEIQETVATMLALKKAGASWQAFAPDRMQHHVVNHLTGDVMDERRNILVEAARIVRGDIRPLSDYDSGDFDGIIFPGGLGVAKNFCDYAFKGSNCHVETDIADVIRESVKAGKIIGAECISPVVMAAVLNGAEVTIGHDAATAADLEALGGVHKEADVTEVVYDTRYKLYTTPCYMEGKDVLDIYKGAEAMVKAMIEG